MKILDSCVSLFVYFLYTEKHTVVDIGAVVRYDDHRSSHSRIRLINTGRSPADDRSGANRNLSGPTTTCRVPSKAEHFKNV